MPAPDARRGLPPSLDAIAALAERALAEMPAVLAQRVDGVGILVEERPDDATLDELGLDSPWDLTGLYRGVPWGQQGVGDPPRLPDTIVLFREPILLEWIETNEDLFRLVRNVLVHEIAHHFGFSDAAIARLEREG